MKIARHFLCSFLWTSVYRLGAGVHAPENAEIRRDLDCRGWSPVAFTVLADRPPRAPDLEVAGGCCVRFSRCATVWCGLRKCVLTACTKLDENSVAWPFRLWDEARLTGTGGQFPKNRICLRGVPLQFMCVTQDLN